MTIEGHKIRETFMINMRGRAVMHFRIPATDCKEDIRISFDHHSVRTMAWVDYDEICIRTQTLI